LGKIVKICRKLWHEAFFLLNKSRVFMGTCGEYSCLQNPYLDPYEYFPTSDLDSQIRVFVSIPMGLLVSTHRRLGLMDSLSWMLITMSSGYWVRMMWKRSCLCVFYSQIRCDCFQSNKSMVFFMIDLWVSPSDRKKVLTSAEVMWGQVACRYKLTSCKVLYRSLKVASLMIMLGLRWSSILI
jgi:hypothetical protein